MQAALQALASPRRRTAPATPLAPLESVEGVERLLDVTNDSGEAAKADQMCEKIGHSVNLLTLTATAHLLASDYFYLMHLRLAISSIAFSSIVAVLGRILPVETIGLGIVCGAQTPPLRVSPALKPTLLSTQWQFLRSATPSTRSRWGSWR